MPTIGFVVQISWTDLKLLRNFFLRRWHWKGRWEPLPLPMSKPKALKAKKAILKGVHSCAHMHTHMHTTNLPMAERRTIGHSPSHDRKLCCLENTYISLENHPKLKQAWPLCSHQISPDDWINHEEDRTQPHTLVFIVNVKANKCQIKQAVKNSMALGWTRSAPWSAPMEKRRHVLDWLLTMMLWIMSTKFRSYKLSLAG